MEYEDIQSDYENGMSVKEIVKKYGVSKSLVYKVLDLKNKDISTGNKDVVNVIYTLAKRKGGITYREEWNILTNMMSDCSGDVRKNIRRAVRVKAKKDGVRVLFVPNWLSTDNTTTPRESLDIMLGIAHELNERILEYVNDYMQMTGNKDKESVEQALLTYAVQGYGNTPFQSYCELIGGIVEELSDDV